LTCKAKAKDLSFKAKSKAKDSIYNAKAKAKDFTFNFKPNQRLTWQGSNTGAYTLYIDLFQYCE